MASAELSHGAPEPFPWAALAVFGHDLLVAVFPFAPQRGEHLLD